MTLSSRQLAQLPEVLFEIGKAIGSDNDPSLLLSRICQLVCEMTGAETCSVMLLSPDGTKLSAKAAFGVHKRELIQEFQVGEGVAGWVVQHAAHALIGDVRVDPRFVVRDASNSTRSMLCVPLATRGEVIGALTATSRALDAFSPTEVELTNFIAKTIALDVQNLRLHKLSVTDTLTGAYNREFLHRKLAVELDNAQSIGIPISVAMIDVDHFKAINDNFGHSVGDLVLAEVGARLKGVIRTTDFLIRYGGEEFLAILPKADAGRAWEVGERMRHSLLSNPVEADGPKEVRVSVGIAEYRGSENDTEDQLIRRADAALYAAKAAGRNRVEVSPK